VSVFGNVDHQGDRVLDGAFKADIEQKRKRQDPIPVVWSHQWGDPFAHIGFIEPQDMYEVYPDTLSDGAKAAGVTGGLYVKGKLDIDKPFAKQVYDLLKQRRVTEWSFAYDVIDEERAKDGANNLKMLRVHEVGPTLKGANSATDTLGVKSRLDIAADEQRTLRRIDEVIAFDNEVGMKMLADWVGMKKDEDEATTDTPDAGDAGDDAASTDADESAAPPDGDTAADPEGEKSIDETLAQLLEAAGIDGEKALLKPWHIAERDGKFCVIKDSDGSVVHCHETHEQAMRQMRALYASEPKDAPAHGEKIGRALSDKNAAAIRGVIDALQALLTEAAADAVDEALTVEPKADEQPDPPVDEIAHYKALLDALVMDQRQG
jgi:hypothetical protein